MRVGFEHEERWRAWMQRHRKGGDDGAERRGGGHGHHRGGRGPGRGLGRGFGGGGRFFDHGELRHVVLSLLNEQPRHGYDIIRAIDERTSGAYAPSPGVIYPTLQLLEDVGHIAQAGEEAARNVYRITPAGRSFLEENGALIGDIMARMNQAGRSHAGASPAVVAAMDNLKSALRSGRGAWSEAEKHKVAEAIDAAAVRIRALRDDAADASGED